MSDAKILVVTTAASIAVDIQLKLASLGYPKPEVALTAAEAVCKAKRTQPDLVLVDKTLDEAVTTAAATGEPLSRLKVPHIYLTSLQDTQICSCTHATEFPDSLAVPCSERDLHIAVTAALYKYELEQQLMASETRFATTLTSIGDVVIAADNTGRVTFMNPVALQLTGWSFSEAENQPLDEVFKIIGSDTRQPVKNPVAKVLVHGATVGLANHTVLISKDGKEIPIDDSAAPIRDDNGNLIGVVLVFRDITEREATEKALRSSKDALQKSHGEMEERVRKRTAELVALNAQLSVEVAERRRAEQAIGMERKRLHDVFEMLPAYLILLTPDYHVPFANRFFRERFGESCGKRCYEYLFGRSEPCDNCETYKVLKTMAPHQWEWTGPDNRNYHIYDFPFQDTDGTTLIMEMGIDITERKRAEEALQTAHDLLEARVAERTAELRASEERYRVLAEELRMADSRKNEFLAVLSHELRNPLASIRTGLHILAQADQHSEQAKRAKQIIDRQVGQLTHLVDDLLDLTRISRNKIHLQCQTLELNELVSRTIEDHIPLFEANGVRLEAVLASSAIPVDADGTRLAQVVGNLLMNAAKFTPGGGVTRVSLAVDDVERKAVLRVADNGVGMAPETISRLFQPFMQADTTLERSRSGLGLGLTLVKGLIELHGGDVSAESTGLGQGAEFTVRLPLAHVTSPVHAVAPVTRSRSSRRVLIIEDNVDFAECLRELLELHEHQVVVAHKGPEGLARAREFRPEVVLCDIGLPDMDGYDVAKAFRADQSLQNAFLVALTGYALPDDLDRAAQVGFNIHLAKPPALEELIRVLAQAPVTA